VCGVGGRCPQKALGVVQKAIRAAQKRALARRARQIARSGAIQTARSGAIRSQIACSGATRSQITRSEPVICPRPSYLHNVLVATPPSPLFFADASPSPCPPPTPPFLSSPPSPPFPASRSGSSPSARRPKAQSSAPPRTTSSARTSLASTTGSWPRANPLKSLRLTRCCASWRRRRGTPRPPLG